MNTRDTLVTDLNVLADFNPVIPESFQDSEFLMLGNLHPATQISVINQMKTRPRTDRHGYHELLDQYCNGRSEDWSWEWSIC